MLESLNEHKALGVRYQKNKNKLFSLLKGINILLSYIFDSIVSFFFFCCPIENHSLKNNAHIQKFGVCESFKCF